MLSAIHDVEDVYKIFFINILNHYNIKHFLCYFDSLTLNNTKEAVARLVNALIKELYEKYYIIYQHDSEHFSHDFSEIYNPLIYLERDKALTEHIESIYSKSGLTEYHKFNNSQKKYFTVFQDIDQNEKDFSFSTVYPNFKTGMRDFTDTKIVLNLSFTFFLYLRPLFQSSFLGLISMLVSFDLILRIFSERDNFSVFFIF